MKIIVPSEGETIDSNISQFFGRCPYFIVIEIEDRKIISSKAFKNPAMNQRGGAGIAAAQFVADQNADALICKSVGPNAAFVLSQLVSKLFKAIDGTVKENAEKFITNELEKLTSPGPRMK